MVWHEPDGPPTQNQWSEVVRETGIPMKWLKKFYDANPSGWNYGETYEKTKGFNRYKNREHKGTSITHCCIGIIACICEDCICSMSKFDATLNSNRDVIGLDKKDLRNIEPEVLIELKKLLELVMKRKKADKSKMSKIKEFHREFIDLLYSDVLQKLPMFEGEEVGEEASSIFKEVAKVIEPKLSNVLQWKIEPFREGWRFKAEEGTKVEYKEAVFVFNEEKFKKKNTQLHDKNKKEYTKKLKEAKAEHKLEIPSTVCAFLNRDGGELYVGVRDDDNIIVGLDADKKFAFGKETVTKFKEKYKRKIIRRLTVEPDCHLKIFLPENIQTEFIQSSVPMIFKITVKPISSDGIPASVLHHEKEIHYVRVEDEDKRYQDEKWSSWCRKRFPTYFNTI